MAFPCLVIWTFALPAYELLSCTSLMYQSKPYCMYIPTLNARVWRTCILATKRGRLIMLEQVKMDTFGSYKPHGKKLKTFFASFCQLVFDNMIRVCCLVLTVNHHDTCLNFFLIRSSLFAKKISRFGHGEDHNNYSRIVLFDLATTISISHLTHLQQYQCLMQEEIEICRTWC